MSRSMPSTCAAAAHDAPEAASDAAPHPPRTVASAREAWRLWRRRWQLWVGLLVLMVICATIFVLVPGDGSERYSIDSTELNGLGAMTAALEDQGVDVESVRTGAEALDALEEDPEAMLVVNEAVRDVNPEAASELGDENRPIVLISPSSMLQEPEFTEVLPVGMDSDDVQPRPAGESCDHPAAQAAESMAAATWLYALQNDDDAAAGDEPSTGTGCFAAEDEGAGGEYPFMETDAGVVFGSPDALTNRRIVEEGHAALALQLFGQRDSVIWYAPAPGDVGSVEDSQMAEPIALLPEWFDALTQWLLICTGILLLVAGRRRGPVVVEPLPVQVPASESAEGRGRMYQQANAVEPSARTLRAAMLVRCARMLRLGAAAEHAVIEAAARQSGHSVQHVWEVLDHRQLRSNTDLLRYAQRIAGFEDELRVRLGLPTRAQQVAEQQVAEQQSPHEQVTHQQGPPPGPSSPTMGDDTLRRDPDERRST